MNHNKIIEQDIIVVDQYQKPSTKDALAQIIKTFFKHPTIIMKNYLKNYCALSSVCLIESPDGVNYKVTNQYDFMKLFENETIAYRVSSHLDNRFYLNDQGNILSQNYQQVNTPGILIEIEKALKMPTSIIYKFSILLLPVALLALIFIRVLRRKHLKAYSLYTLSLILLGYAFLGVLANALSGSIIDRYSVGMFIPGLLGIISLITFLILNIKLEKGEITNEKRKS